MLPPDLAAVIGTAGELSFGTLIVLGIAGRLSAFGLSAVNVMAVISYSHGLFSEAFEAALGQHILWGFMLLVLMVHSPGRGLTLDRLLARGLSTSSASLRLI